jgi:hypothetical protein
MVYLWYIGLVRLSSKINFKESMEWLMIKFQIAG